MVSPDLTARLRYLNDSAHLLATTAPATSKYLISQCNSLMFDNNIEQSESHKRNACGACGTIMILGWNSKLKVELRRARQGKGSSGKAATDRSRAMVYTCESCGRKARFNISTSPSFVPKTRAVSLSHTKHTSGITRASNTSLSGHSTPAHSQPSNTSTTTPSGISNGKKRTKTRKHGGLEAIIARQKASDSRASSGFDLLDFMKKA